MSVALCEVPIGRVEEELVGLAGQLSAGLCRGLLLLGEFDRRQGWAGWGIRSCAHWLSIRLAVSPSTARAQLRVAHALAGLPLVTEQFAVGRLSYSQVRALCRVADATNEADLVQLAQEMNADQLERMCRLLRGLDDATDAEVPDLTSITVRWGEDGTATIRVRLPNDDAAVVVAAVEERVKKAGLPGEVPWEARRALALAEVVADGAQVASPVRERPLVHITVPLADLEAAKGGTVDGRPIADATLRRMLCDGSVVGVALDAHGQPVSVGTRTRVPSTRIQREVDVRDGRVCTYPGCGRPSEETHHVTAPTGLRFASPEPPEATAARLAPTLRSRFEHEGNVWVTSTPDLITVTPGQAGAGSLVTIELTTHPRQLTTTLTAIGLTVAHADVPDSPGGDDG